MPESVIMPGSEWVSSAKASSALGVSRATLVKWADEGRIRFIRPGGKGHRRLDVTSVLPEAEAHEKKSHKKVNVIYGRVSKSFQTA